MRSGCWQRAPVSRNVQAHTRDMHCLMKPWRHSSFRTSGTSYRYTHQMEERVLKISPDRHIGLSQSARRRAEAQRPSKFRLRCLSDASASNQIWSYDLAGWWHGALAASERVVSILTFEQELYTRRPRYSVDRAPSGGFSFN